MIKLLELTEKINPRGIEVRPIRGEYEADTFDVMLRKHYLGGANKNVNIKLGIFSYGKMIGIAAYGPPTSMQIMRQLNLNSGEIYELRRFYTEETGVHNLEGQALTLANDELEELRPETKVVVTYADPQQGHMGTLYQATNAIYLGKGIGKGGKHKYIYILGNKSQRKHTLKRISMTQQEYPKKDLQEFTAEGFDLDEFLNIRSFAGQVRYANEKLRRLASGSARIIYIIDDKTVLKLAKNEKGLAQNEVEASLGTDRMVGDIVAKVLEADENNRWIVMEKAKKISKSRFKQLVGVDLRNFEYYLKFTTDYRIGHMFSVEPEIAEILDENEFAQSVVELIHNFNIQPGDFGRPSSFGEINGNIVITDYGLTQEVYKKYYDKRYY